MQVAHTKNIPRNKTTVEQCCEEKEEWDEVKDDIVYMPRAAVEYITYRGIRYYLAQNSNFVLATIRGEI